MTAIQRATAVWLVLLAEVVIFGTAGFARFISPRGKSRDELGRAFAPLWRSLALVALVIAPVVLAAVTSEMAGIGIGPAFGFVPEVLAQTHFGHIWLGGFSVIVLLNSAAWIPIRSDRRGAILLLLSGVLLVLRAFASHAIDHGTLAVAVYFVHEACAGLWLGAVMGLWFGAAYCGMGPQWVEAAAPRVSIAAESTVALLLASGCYSAWWALDHDLDRLIYSVYGRVLTIKVAAAIAVLLVGGYNRLVLVPTVADCASERALVRNVGLESAALCGVVWLAAILANSPPVH